MDAHKLWMLRDFIGTNKVLFRIPVYQRNYDWSEANCDRLLDDIYEIINSGDKHFLGTIVFMAAKSGGFTLQEYTIIDGQQRLTTMMLILKALAVVAETGGDTCFQEIDEQYLHNKYCDEKYKVKLKPIKSDNNQFLLLLANKTDEMDEDTHIFQNYRLCKERFERWAEKGICPSQVLDALTKLEIVEIVLTKGEDDPQVIFESINSTGLDLSNADLIRNFLLMNADDQERLYEEYWLIIEKTLRNKMDYSNLDDFFMQYIVYKTGKPVNSRQLYHSFVKLFKGSNYTQEAILDELRYYAKIYGAFVYGNKDYRITDDSIEFEYVETITLDHYDEVTGKKLVSFKLFGETYRQNKYALMLLDVIKLLDKKKPGKLQELANRHYSFNSTKRKHVHLNTDGVGMRWPWKLSDTIYLEANLSAWSCIRFIDNLISEFGFDRSQFSFNIVSEESDESIENEE